MKRLIYILILISIAIIQQMKFGQQPKELDAPLTELIRPAATRVTEKPIELLGYPAPEEVWPYVPPPTTVPWPTPIFPTPAPTMNPWGD